MMCSRMVCRPQVQPDPVCSILNTDVEVDLQVGRSLWSELRSAYVHTGAGHNLIPKKTNKKQHNATESHPSPCLAALVHHEPMTAPPTFEPCTARGLL